MTQKQKKEALQNALNHYGLSKNYFVFPADGRLGHKFAIAKELEHGAINPVTRFMTYDEFNAYLQGYNDAILHKFPTAI